MTKEYLLGVEMNMLNPSKYGKGQTYDHFFCLLFLLLLFRYNRRKFYIQWVINYQHCTNFFLLTRKIIITRHGLLVVARFEPVKSKLLSNWPIYFLFTLKKSSGLFCVDVRSIRNQNSLNNFRKTEQVICHYQRSRNRWIFSFYD